MLKNVLHELPKHAPHLAGWPWTLDSSPVIYDPHVEWPKISIITPSFNQGKYIEETIRSVLLQNYPNLEYIIIDGGSSDESVDVIKKYENHLSCWISGKDKGQSDAINKGLAKCTGEIFNWLNSDDVYLPGTLFEIAMAFFKNPDAVFVSGYENHVSPGNCIQLYTGTFLCKTLEETIEYCQVAQPSTFFKLESVKAIHGVSNDLHYIMDGEMWVKLLLTKGQRNFYKIKKTLVNFRKHETSKTTNQASGNFFLIERCSIIADLQRFAGVPNDITRYYIDHIYRCPEIYQLKRSWKLNDNVISKRRLKIYFVKKYTINQLIRNNRKQVWRGLNELLKTRAFDIFLVKNILKLVLKNIKWHATRGTAVADHNETS